MKKLSKTGIMAARHIMLLVMVCVIVFSAASANIILADTGKREEKALPEVEFSLEAGAYAESSKDLELSVQDGYEIYYTTDGSTPTTQSTRYTQPINLTREGNIWVDKDTVSQMLIQEAYKINVNEKLPRANIIRAIAVAPDETMGNVVTKTYWIGQDMKQAYNGAMVISIVTDEINLLDYNSGILATGSHYDAWRQTTESEDIISQRQWWLAVANYTQKGRAWERPASIELFDGSNSLTLQQDGGIRIKGGASRMYSQKSFDIFFRNEYGAKEILYPIFQNAEDGPSISRYKGFTLRNGGNDTEYLKFKDSWQQSLLRDRDFATQQDRPAIVFLNGEYWGVYNLNDKYNSSYIHDNYGVKDPIVVKEGELVEGKTIYSLLYDELMMFADMDLSKKENWDQFVKIMDVQSIADYYAAEIYMGNADWDEHKNIALWRSSEVDRNNPYADGKWRYMMYDTEYASSLYNQEKTNVEFNSLEAAIENHSLFAAALQNPEFREMFKTSIKEIGLRNFASDTVNRTLKEWAAEWKPFMKDYYFRFGDTSWAWDSNIKNIKDYYAKRYDVIIPIVEDVLPEIGYSQSE